MANTYTMTVGEMIDAAFGDSQCARIDFNLVETIIYLLASKLRVLDREILVESSSSISAGSRNSSTIVVSEVKLKTLKYKKIKDNRPHGRDKKPGEHIYQVQKIATDNGESDKPKQYRSKDETKKDTTTSGKTKKLQSEEKPPKDKELLKAKPSKHDFENKPGKEVHVLNVTSTKRTGAKPSKLPTIESGSENETEGAASKTTKSSNSIADNENAETDTITSDETRRYYNMLQKLEEKRERVLRVIRQRADSHEEAMHSPSPMASMESTEVEFEKLLVVEKGNEGQGDPRPTTALEPTLSMVTRDKFTELLNGVVELQQQFTLADHPAHFELLEKLRQGVSLSDTLAAAQISSRLDATEKAIQQITRMLSEVQRTGRFTVLEKTDSQHFEIPEALLSGFILKPSDSSHLQIHSETELVESFHELPQTVTQEKIAYVTKPEMEEALAKLYEEVFRPFSVAMETHTADIEMAKNKSIALERKFADLSSVNEKIIQIERTVQSFIREVNAIDAALTSQLTNVLEQMTRLQFDLEAGLERINDAAVHQGIDAEGMVFESEMATMTGNFQHLQNDIEKLMDMQKDLHARLERLAMEFQFLRTEHEMLRDSKCDREEFADALRDKVGIETINNMITEETLISVMGGYHESLEEYKKKFFVQEVSWQKSIDDLNYKILNKVDTKYLNGLNADINKHLNKFKKRLDKILAIVGEPLSAVVTRSIYRDTKCLSCCNPAHVVPPDRKVPALPKFKPQEKETDTGKPKEDRDTETCIPGLKILHRIDPRSQICTRYCGGEHTVQKKQPKLRRSFKIKRLQEPKYGEDTVNAEEGNESNKSSAKPCIHCNLKTIYDPTHDTEDRKSTTRLLSSFSEKSIRDFNQSRMIPTFNPAQHSLHSLSTVDLN